MPEQDRHGWAEDRYLYLFGELTDELTRDVVARLFHDRHRDMVMLINSDGGSSFNALALVNAIKMHGRVDTFCVGVALSGAADCLAAGRHRRIVPNAIAMIHQVSWDLGHEFAANLVKNAQFLDRLNNHMLELLARDTNQPPEKLRQDIATDYYLFGQEIIDYGLADEFFDASQPLLMAPPRRLRTRAEGA
ncbi:MAG: ATP-dependent Clp protease proteolytic subunit, partial [Armatimonadetes bacterium]|nr:ATP-dependent Clp protease proteolytic subunit [Armatimonadota bacterium]